jgi:Cd2+/Zn2+-exporting ATPase/Cu+-exporting ATPase
VPEAIRIGRRTFRVIQQNLALGLVYNLVGISLAALGLLPPVAAAAGQSIPDLLVMFNSARLLRRPSKQGA